MKKQAIDRPAGARASVQSVEWELVVTPEMVTAGAEILSAWAPDVMSPTIAYGLAEEVITRALARARGQS